MRPSCFPSLRRCRFCYGRVVSPERYWAHVHGFEIPECISISGPGCAFAGFPWGRLGIIRAPRRVFVSLAVLECFSFSSLIILYFICSLLGLLQEDKVRLQRYPVLGSATTSPFLLSVLVQPPIPYARDPVIPARNTTPHVIYERSLYLFISRHGRPSTHRSTSGSTALQARPELQRGICQEGLLQNPRTIDSAPVEGEREKGRADRKSKLFRYASHFPFPRPRFPEEPGQVF